MRIHISGPAAGALLALACFACGSDSLLGEQGSREFRPIEVLYYVSGGPGIQFRFRQEPSPSECGSTGAGLQSTNADHRFGERIFETPHLFVLENESQPVRAVIENIDDGSGLPLDVNLYFGDTLRTRETIDPGECRTVGSADPDASLPAQPLGREVRIEICSPDEPADPADTPCVSPSGQAPPPDQHLAFFATVGDLEATNVTQCQMLPVAQTCLSPATFFLEDASDTVSAVIGIFGSQPIGAVLRIELYVDGDAVDVSTGTDDIIVSHDL